jgi:hypothetical protein
MNSSGTIVHTYSVPGVTDFLALDLDPDGETFLLGSFTSSALYRFDIESGALTQTIGIACGSPCGISGITIDPTPTPEPATLLLLGTTAAGLGWARRRHRLRNGNENRGPRRGRT